MALKSNFWNKSVQYDGPKSFVNSDYSAIE